LTQKFEIKRDDEERFLGFGGKIKRKKKKKENQTNTPIRKTIHSNSIQFKLFLNFNF